MGSKSARRPTRFAKPMAPSGVRFKYAALLNIDLKIPDSYSILAR